MSENNRKTTFGKLLEHYRKTRELSQLALERLLYKNNYPITNGLIHRYESGTRRPPVRFIVQVARLLELTEQQFQALLDARLIDESANLYDEIQNVLEADNQEAVRRPSTKSRQKEKATNLTNKLIARHPLKIFLCHSSADKPVVRKLYQRLLKDGFDPWLDEEKLLGGQDWDDEIQKAVCNSDTVIVCLSHSSITKAGYVQKEIKFALDEAEMQPENTIFLIPLRIEECAVPNRLRRWQWVNLFHESGYEHLIKALQLRAKDLELTPS